MTSKYMDEAYREVMHATQKERLWQGEGEEKTLAWDTRITKIYKGGEKWDSTVNSENHDGFYLTRSWGRGTWKSQKYKVKKALGKEERHIKSGGCMQIYLILLLFPRCLFVF